MNFALVDICISFDVLCIIPKALVRSKNLTALALSQNICDRAPARAQNILSAAQFCAHFRIFKG